jgi:curved DNA-binding protein CbpA
MSIQAAETKAQMIKTVLMSPEHVASARQAGIYGHLLHFVQEIEAGRGAPAAQRTTTTGPAPGVQTIVVHGDNNGGANAQLKNVNASEKGNEKALNYFSACLRILDLEEEVALTEQALKSAYKKAVVRAHPDKQGGSEKEFEAVTRAYAYLGDILRRIHGGRKAGGVVEAPSALKSGRESEADQWKHVQPVRLNPAKLDLTTFNTMFEKTRIPDPEENGYGDWLKGGDAGAADSAPKFSGKFNREVFQKVFEEEVGKRGSNVKGGAMVAQEMSLASRMGYATELGRTGRDDYTVAANDPGLKYTDLKKAYTEYNTFSQDTRGVQVENRSFEQVQQSRGKAPAPLRDEEMEALQAAEAAAKRAEERRQLQMAQEAAVEQSYFDRMKQLVLRN